MLNQTAEHALRAILFLARTENGEAVPAERIAEALGAPGNYLGKTLNTLAKRGLLSSARGPAGGFRLLRDADDLTVAEVVAAVSDGPRPSTRCLLGNQPCHADAPCAAHVRWSAVREETWWPLRRTTIADLLRPASEVPSDAGGIGVHPRIACAV